MKKDLAKTICICKGCKELLEFQSRYTSKIVDEKDCDYLIMSDGSFQFEHKERN